MLKTTLVRAFLLLLACAFSAFAGDLPYYSAARIADAPTIDGTLDDACWQQTERTTPFVQIGGQAARLRTTGMLCWDSRALYLALECEEPDMRLIDTRIKSGQMAGFEQSIEVFIDSNYDRSTFCQLRVGVLGEFEIRKDGALAPEVQAGCAAGVRRYADKWTVEMAIPFHLLGGNPPAPHTIWGLNLNGCRGMAQQGGVELTCWSDTKVGAFAVPDRFGNLVFASFPLWLRCHYGLRVGNLMDEIADLVMRYPESGKPFLPEIRRLDTLWAEYLKALAAPGADAATEGEKFRAEGDRVAVACAEVLARLRLEVIKTAFR